MTPQEEQKELEEELRGLGDAVDDLLRATQIKQLINRIAKKACVGCEQRRKALNNSKLSKMIYGNNQK